MENSELRAQARTQLRGEWGKMALATFVYTLIVFPALYLFQDFSQYHELLHNPLHNPTMSLLIQIAFFIVTGPFAYGFVNLFMKRIRGNEISVPDIFEGFNKFLPCFLLYMLQIIFIVLWTLLLIVPGIIKGFAYSQAYYILYDNPGMKPMEALKKSQQMMKGYKGKLFMLYLSFLGWSMLCVLTLGIGYFWLQPYMGLSLGNFYEDLKKSQEQPVIENNTAGNEGTV